MFDSGAQQWREEKASGETPFLGIDRASVLLLLLFLLLPCKHTRRLPQFTPSPAQDGAQYLAVLLTD